MNDNSWLDSLISGGSAIFTATTAADAAKAKSQADAAAAAKLAAGKTNWGMIAGIGGVVLVVLVVLGFVLKRK